MLCASNMNFTIVIPFLVAVRIKGLSLSFPRHTILASFTDTLVSPGSGCNQRESMVMISVMDIGDFTPSAARSMRGWQLAALKAAISARNPPRGCVHHSDRGSQYASETYRAVLREHGFVGSMSRRGNPYDNAKAESFMKTLKVEAVYLMGRDFRGRYG